MLADCSVSPVMSAAGNPSPCPPSSLPLPAAASSLVRSRPWSRHPATASFLVCFCACSLPVSPSFSFRTPLLSIDATLHKPQGKHYHKDIGCDVLTARSSPMAAWLAWFLLSEYMIYSTETSCKLPEKQHLFVNKGRNVVVPPKLWLMIRPAPCLKAGEAYAPVHMNKNYTGAILQVLFTEPQFNPSSCTKKALSLVHKHRP